VKKTTFTPHEVALRRFWRKRAPGVEACSARAQLLCLGKHIGDDPLGQRAHVAEHAWR